MLDNIDKELLKELQIDSNRKVHQIGKNLGIPRTTIHNRIKKLEKEGYIKGYKAIVDAEKLDKGLTVIMGMTVGVDTSTREVAAEIKKYPEIEEVFIISGQFDIILKARIKNTKELSKLIFDMEAGLRTLHGVTRTESMVVLSTEKENSVIEAY